MAGIYRHVVDEDGDFVGVRLLDNLGDAYEALEECCEMIQYLTDGDKAKIWEAYLNGYFKKHCPLENLPLVTFERFWE